MTTFTTTPGDPAANSYATIAEADDYLLERRLHVADENWKRLGNDEKEAALIWATQVLDQYEFIGTIASTDQALQWPRNQAFTSDGRTVPNDEIPAVVKDAQAEIAHSLVETDLTATPAGEAYEKVKVGPIEVTLRDQAGTAAALDQVPEDVQNMLKRYLRTYGIHIPILRA
jgi:hypothetical protein